MSQKGSYNSTDYIKRKKKRSFVSRVQKRHKSFSKGTRLDTVEHEYFLRIFKVSQDFKGSKEDKFVFANNALTQTEGREVDCSSNQLVSRVVESLLHLGSNQNLKKYFDAFGADLRPICDHEYASHVLQALMIIAARHTSERFYWQEEDSLAAHQTECKAWLLKVCKYLLNNIEEFIWGKNANPTLRTAMYCLAGLPLLDKHNSSENNFLTDTISNQPSESDPPEEFKNLLEEYFTRISSWSQFNDFGKNPLCSRYLQSLLKTLKNIKSKKFKELANKIYADFFSNDSSSAMFSSTALPILEVIIELEKPKGKGLKKIYDDLIADRLKEMSVARPANITVQKFLDKCNDPGLVADMVGVLVPEFSQIIKSHTEGVLVSLCNACERLNTAQSEFLLGLTRALKCEESIIPGILCLTPLPHGTPPPNPKLQGSLIVQGLLRFQQPFKVVKSLLSYSDAQLAELVCSVYGSHIASAFCKSPFVSDKSKQKLVKKLAEHYSSLAQNKFGSRSFDELWDVANKKLKVKIARNLASESHKITNSQYGKFVAYKVRLDDFRNLDTSHWLSELQSMDKKRKLFAPIIGDVKKRKK